MKPLKLAMFDDDTLEMVDFDIRVKFFLADLIINWLNLESDTLLNSVKAYMENQKDEKSSAINMPMLYDGNSIIDATRTIDFLLSKLIENPLQEGNMSPDRLNAMGQVSEYILDVLNPFQLLSKSIIMHKATPGDFFGFKAHTIIYLITDGIYVNDGYDFVNLHEFLQFAVIKVFTSKTLIKECANCGKLFRPSSRSDEIYCDRVVNQGTRTCKQVGYENKNESIKAYRTAYKTKNAMKNRYNNICAENAFKNWVYAAKIKLEKSQNGIITLEEFKKWLKQK